MNILKGNIVFTETKEKFTVMKNSYIVVDESKVVDIFETLPKKYENLKVEDFGDKIIIPALVDLHVHAPQYSFRGVGYDLELLDWLNKYTFKAESKLEDTNYAKKLYTMFCDDLLKNGTLRAVIFGTIHNDANYILMEQLEKKGIEAYVGKVNMDRNVPDYLCQSTKDSIEETKDFVKNTLNKYKEIYPIVTPRFLPTCTKELLESLGEIALNNKIPVQSHLSENTKEIQWVKQLFPECKGYADGYDKYGMLGKDVKSIMAHCIHLTDEEIEVMKKRDVYVAHCPNSNCNLSSGIAPLKKLMLENIKIGLGSDIAGGFNISIFKAMSEAIRMSKLKYQLENRSIEFLSVSEAFYLGTKGGATFFSDKVNFEKGAPFKALVIDDSTLGLPLLTIEDRMERIIHLADDRNIVKRFH